MKRILALSLVALGLLAAAPLVLGDTCLPACEVRTQAMLLFVPSVSLVESGSSLTWLSSDNTAHTATDRAGYCFHSSFSPGGDGSALFFIADGALFATSEAGDAQPCEAADVLPDGSFLLDYECLLHPNMKGKILVR